jgi:hypothetical protein
METLTTGEIIFFTAICTIIAVRFFDVGKMIYTNAMERKNREEADAKKVFLIDIDGTICDDIKNEYSEMYPKAQVFEGSQEIINKWYDEGHEIHFFTARQSKDRLATELWLRKHKFKYHGLIMDKPRIKDGWEYAWIDNRKVRAVTYLGTWSELKEVQKSILLFDK